MCIIPNDAEHRLCPGDGLEYMAALKTVYAPLNRYRKGDHLLQVIFFTAAIVLQNLLTLGSLEVWNDHFVPSMTFSPILIEVITEWLHRMYEKSEAKKKKKGWIGNFLEKVQKTTVKEWGKMQRCCILPQATQRTPIKPRKNRGSFSA